MASFESPGFIDAGYDTDGNPYMVPAVGYPVAPGRGGESNTPYGYVNDLVEEVMGGGMSPYGPDGELGYPSQSGLS